MSRFFGKTERSLASDDRAGMQFDEEAGVGGFALPLNDRSVARRHSRHSHTNGSTGAVLICGAGAGSGDFRVRPKSEAFRGRRQRRQRAFQLPTDLLRLIGKD